MTNRKKRNAYNRYKPNKDIHSILEKEETYWIGAAGTSMLLVGFIDGGLSVAIAYVAKKIYDTQIQIRK